MMQEQQLGYRGKHFSVPTLSKEGLHITPNPDAVKGIDIPQDSPIVQDLNTIWDTKKFLTPRKPISLGQLTADELTRFTKPDAPRILDMPIKFPGSDFRLPKELEQFREVVQRVADFEARINPDHFHDYYCYMTVDSGVVQPGQLLREAPCHVDGFQGARWNPKVMINHSYTVGDILPTAYYVQPFDFSQLDEAKHNFFWEMNRQVALTDSRFAWQSKDAEITLMDAYCVHRGVPAEAEVRRTWVRLSFEVRVFDRLGNAHNPMFDYNWEMVPRDIEGLNLVAFDQTSDPSLRVFPWQDEQGNAFADRSQKTQPKLTLAAATPSLSEASIEKPPTQAYHNPAPVVVMLVPVIGKDPKDGALKEGVLGVVRSIEPKLGQPSLVGGYMEYEDWRHTGVREVAEETGIELTDESQVRLLSVESVENGKKLLLFATTNPILESDLKEFVPTNESNARVIFYEPQELAFPTHTQALKDFFAAKERISDASFP